MDRLRLVTDSTCDLPAELVEKHEIAVVPVWIHFGTESYREGVDITPDLFYRKLGESQIVPKSSQPSPGQLAEVYQRITSQGDMVISIHVTAKTSGMYNSAVLARTMVPEGDIEIVDSASVSLGMGFQVLAAAQAIARGLSKSQVLEVIAATRARTYLYGTVPDLDFLRRSGRVSHLRHLLANLLDIKPILSLREGIVDAVERTRTRRRSLERILELIVQGVGARDPVRAAVVHANAPQEASWLYQRVRETLNCQELYLQPAGLALAANAGPGLVGIVAQPLEGHEGQ